MFASRLIRAIIHSTLGGPCHVRYGEATATLPTKAGEYVTLDAHLMAIP
jgi:hypothetical protein